MLDYESYPIIAAVKSGPDFDAALESEVQTIFLLSSNIIDVDSLVTRTHAKGKLLFIHMDFVDGLSKDPAGVRYLATKGVDGVISTRSHIVGTAKESGLLCVQRCFMIDSRSVDTALESIRQSKADMVEIMPGIAYKSIQRIQKSVSIPIIAGGLVEFREEVYQALNAGASMVSTGKAELWDE